MKDEGRRVGRRAVQFRLHPDFIAHTSLYSRLMFRLDATLERILSSAIRAQCRAGFFDRQKNPRVRVPQQHGRRRTVQREVGRRDFDLPLLIIGLGHNTLRCDGREPVTVGIVAAVDDIEKGFLQPGRDGSGRA